MPIRVPPTVAEALVPRDRAEAADVPRGARVRAGLLGPADGGARLVAGAAGGRAGDLDRGGGGRGGSDLRALASRLDGCGVGRLVEMGRDWVRVEGLGGCRGCWQSSGGEGRAWVNSSRQVLPEDRAVATWGPPRLCVATCVRPVHGPRPWAMRGCSTPTS